MARITFTQNLQRHVTVPDASVTGSTVREALESFFATRPDARSYVLDDQGGLRKHMMIFVDGRQISDRRGLSDPIEEQSEIHVMQALSGG